MRTIIAGSRGLDSAPVLHSAIDDFYHHGYVISEVVSGGARGVDRMGEAWARRQGIPVQQFIPDWAHEGRAAGLLRNESMAAYAEALIALWDGHSRGTAHMIRVARATSLVVFAYRCKDLDGAVMERLAAPIADIENR